MKEVISAILGGRLADVFGRKRLLLTGVILFAVSSTVSGAAVARPMMVAGRFGQGLHGVTAQNSSLASGVQGTMQQIGGALGLAVLVTLALRSASSKMHQGVRVELATTEGYVLAFCVGATLILLGGLLIAAFFERVSPELRDPTAELVANGRRA